MKRFLITVAAVALSASAALGADLKLTKAPPPPPPAPSPWDVAFGAAIMSDYMWRGITQSGHNPSVAAYTELRYNYASSLQFYGAISGESISFPNRAAAEIDLYGGVRPTFGPVAFDFGYWYYDYPGGQCFYTQTPGLLELNPGCSPALPNGNVAKQNWNFWEVYAKATWTINPQWALGANYYYSPNLLNFGPEGNYVSGTLKFTSPWQLWTAGWYVSGEYGRQFIGNSDPFYGTAFNPAGFKYVDYSTWNVGVGFTWKVFTLDIRYWDSSLTPSQCSVWTSAQTASFNPGTISIYNPAGLNSNWCGSTVVAKLAFDMTLDSLK